MATVTPEIESLNPSYNLQDWQKGYQSQRNEYEYEIEEIEGKIPLELQGTLFRNGPGLFEVQGTPIKHPFDGDGMISAISFQEGRAYFRNRFVRTEAFIQEQKAGKMLYRGVFGSQKPGGLFKNIFDLKLKNIANTNVIYWGGKLLALWEAAEPYRLDPHSLETLGIDYLDGIIKPGGSFSAHPWIDPNCQFDNGEPCLVNFSIKTGNTSIISLYEINPQGKLLRTHKHSIPGFAFIHDFAITKNYCIFLQNPVKFNPLPYIFGLKGAAECLDFQKNSPSKLIIISRDPHAKNPVKILETHSGFVFHHGNAFELDENRICLDSIAYDDLPQIKPDTSYQQTEFSQLAPGKLYRFTIDLSRKTVQRQLLENRCCEFPTLHPNYVGKFYRYLYLGAAHHPQGNAPLQAIIKLDLRTEKRQFFSFAPHGFVSEPIFVPRKNATDEDEGWVLTVVYNGSLHRSDIVILDGKDLTKGAIATLHLKHHIPYGLHGSWTDTLVSI